MEIDTILKALKVVCDENKVDATPDMILDCATRIWCTKFISASKNGSTSSGATDKQIATMEKLNIEFDKNISKKDASSLISKKIDTFKD